MLTTETTWLVTSIAVAILAIALWLLFRRVVPKDLVLQEDLPADCYLIPSGAKLPEESRRLLKESFLENPDVTNFKPLSEKDGLAKQAMKELINYANDFCMVFAERYGYVIEYRKKEKYLGSLCIFPPYPGPSWLMDVHQMATLASLGLPPASVRKCPEVYAKLSAFDDLSKKHHELMKDRPHWYLLNVGVAPGSKGHGIGRKLVNLTKDLARRNGNRGGDNKSETTKLLHQKSAEPLPVYLECPDYNVVIYEKLNFRLLERILCHPKPIPGRAKPPEPFGINCMIYEPGTTTKH